MLCKEDMRGELRVSDAEKAAAAFRDAITNLDAIECELSAAEERIWQPHWSKHDPLAERLRRLGVTAATVELVVCLIRDWHAFRRGEPLRTDTLLDQHGQSEASANEQLAQRFERQNGQQPEGSRRVAPF